VTQIMSIDALLLNGFGQNSQIRADEYDSSHSYHRVHVHHGEHASKSGPSAQDRHGARNLGGDAKKWRGNGEE